MNKIVKTNGDKIAIMIFNPSSKLRKQFDLFDFRKKNNKRPTYLEVSLVSQLVDKPVRESQVSFKDSFGSLNPNLGPF